MQGVDWLTLHSKHISFVQLKLGLRGYPLLAEIKIMYPPDAPVHIFGTGSQLAATAVIFNAEPTHQLGPLRPVGWGYAAVKKVVIKDMVAAKSVIIKAGVANRAKGRPKTQCLVDAASGSVVCVPLPFLRPDESGG
jgi:hypothetical protein